METFDIYENLSMNQIFVVKCKGKIIYFKTILDKIKIRGKTRKKQYKIIKFIKYKIYHANKLI